MRRYIDADALERSIVELPYGYRGMVKNIIAEQPTADARENRKGKWILLQEADETGNALYECSVCHKGEVHVPIIEVSYCWNCGADMRGGQDGA